MQFYNLEIYHKQTYQANYACPLRDFRPFGVQKESLFRTFQNLRVTTKETAASFSHKNIILPFFVAKAWCPSFRSFLSCHDVKRLKRENLSLANGLTFYCSPSCHGIVRRCTIGLRSELDHFEVTNGALHAVDCVHFRQSDTRKKGVSFSLSFTRGERL